MMKIVTEMTYSNPKYFVQYVHSVSPLRHRFLQGGGRVAEKFSMLGKRVGLALFELLGGE